MKKPSFLFLTITLVFLTCVISCNDYLYDMLKEKPDNSKKYETIKVNLLEYLMDGDMPPPWPYKVTVKTFMSAPDSPTFDNLPEGLYPTDEPPYSTLSYTVNDNYFFELPPGYSVVSFLDAGDAPHHIHVWVCLVTFDANDNDGAAPRATDVPVPMLMSENGYDSNGNYGFSSFNIERPSLSLSKWTFDDSTEADFSDPNRGRFRQLSVTVFAQWE